MAAAYPPIGDYGLLSDCNSAALVSRRGSIDWACLRRFDASSVFGRLLDWHRGGYFDISPVVAAQASRRYVGDSLVLETRFDTDGGSMRVVDAFAMREGGESQPRHHLIRVVDGLEGAVEVDVHIEPRFDLGELRPLLRHHEDTGAYSAVGGNTAIVLTSRLPLHVDPDSSSLTARTTVRGGQRLRFSVESQRPEQLDARPHADDEVDRRLQETIEWWHHWASETAAGGPYSEQVRRSAVVLKGLTCGPTGAVVAAPTTSLPEAVGGERNWDYRYSWVRDASLVVAALAVAGQTGAARAFRNFLMRSAGGHTEDLRIMYGLDGARYLPELTLSLEGYRGSRPVRVGNAAFRQCQHDVFGQLLELAHLWHVTRDPIVQHEWRFLRAVVDRAADVWQEPDQGIWEVRTAPRHFVHSKAMLWAAMDRGIRFVEEEGFDADVDRWRSVRQTIRDTIDDRGVRHGHFVQAFDTDEVDAALLVLPMIGFVAAADERMQRTVERIRETLTVDSLGLVRRYRTERVHDGVSGHEGVFLMCSLWLVDALAMQGFLDDAEALFERVLAVANDLGLLAEQYAPESGELRGNFPQAFTHMAVINSAHQLACANRDGRRCREQPWSTTDRLSGSRGSSGTATPT